jgi:hypothetical protein
MRTTAASTLAALLLLPAAALAQDPMAPAPIMPDAAPPPADEEPTVNFKIGALVDTYYLYNFTGDPSLQGPSGRTFDTNANSFTLNYLKLSGVLDAGMVGFRYDLGFGNMAQILNDAALGTFGSPEAVFAQQAFARLKLVDGALTIDAGRFVTQAGAEVIEANLNWLYSRSLLFNGISRLHTGVRATYTVSPMVSAMISVQNSINPLDPDNNAAKTFAANVVLTPLDTTTIALTGYFGEEPGVIDDDDLYILIDLVANHKLSDMMAINLNFDYFKRGDDNWLGVAVMLRAALSEMLYVAGRGEFIASDQGYLGLDGNIYEGTVMAGLPFGSNYELRAELRGDFSDEDIFDKGGEPRSNQFTGLIAFLAFIN